MLYRHSEALDRDRLDASKRTVPVAFSTEYPVLRYDYEEGDYWEVLSHDPDSVDLSRFADGSAPLLDTHDMRRQIGVVESAVIGLDRKARAAVRFGRSGLADEIFNDVKDGIRRNVSVGYELLKVLSRTTASDGKPELRFAWRPYEISIVPVPADPNAGVGRMLTRGGTKEDPWSTYLDVWARVQGRKS